MPLSSFAWPTERVIYLFSASPPASPDSSLHNYQTAIRSRNLAMKTHWGCPLSWLGGEGAVWSVPPSSDFLPSSHAALLGPFVLTVPFAWNPLSWTTQPLSCRCQFIWQLRVGLGHPNLSHVTLLFFQTTYRWSGERWGRGVEMQNSVCHRI